MINVSSRGDISQNDRTFVLTNKNCTSIKRETKEKDGRKGKKRKKKERDRRGRGEGCPASTGYQLKFLSTIPNYPSWYIISAYAAENLGKPTGPYLV